MRIPSDPAILVSMINTMLRDEYDSFDELCAAEGADAEKLSAALAASGYTYDARLNRFH